MLTFRFVFIFRKIPQKLKIFINFCQHFQFEFEAIAADAENGHIALDDIVYQANTECGDTLHDNCDFQNGFCKWKNQQPEIGSWVLTSNEESGAR